MKFDLFEKLRCLLDQPVRIFTDDERMITGMVVGVTDGFVRIHDVCGDIFLVSICHIVAVEEPHMRLLRRCCERNHCCQKKKWDGEEDAICDCDGEREGGRGCDNGCTRMREDGRF